MADELSITASLAFAKSGSQEFARAVTDKKVTVTGNGGIYDPAHVTATTEKTIDVGTITTLGWFYAKNLDATDSIRIKTAAAGTIIVEMKPGEFCFFRFGSGVTAPVSISSAGAPKMEYFLLPA